MSSKPDPAAHGGTLAGVLQAQVASRTAQRALAESGPRHEAPNDPYRLETNALSPRGAQRPLGNVPVRRQATESPEESSK